jgi:hypothetical protein
VPAAFEFPAMELKLVNLSMPGLLSTSMVVMAHPSIGGGWKTLGTLVVLTCVAYILMCTAVLYYMEKYKPVRFAYDQSFPTGRGTKTNYREASMYEKVRAIVLFQSVKIGSWQLSTGENLHWSRSGGHEPMPEWLTFSWFGDEAFHIEANEQFHRNWSPLYSKFRGDKGKINYIVEMGQVFFMCVFLAGATGATQSVFLVILANAQMAYNALCSPYADNFSSNSNEVVMRTLKNVTFLYPLLGYLTPLSFETIGNCMLYTQMVGLAINIMFQMFAPVLALIGFCRSVVMPFAAEMGKMGDFMEMVADAKGDSKLSIPKVPQLSTEQAQAILNHALSNLCEHAEEVVKEAALSYKLSFDAAREAWVGAQTIPGILPSLADKQGFKVSAMQGVEESIDPDADQDDSGDQDAGEGTEKGADASTPEKRGSAAAAEEKGNEASDDKVAAAEEGQRGGGSELKRQPSSMESAAQALLKAFKNNLRAYVEDTLKDMITSEVEDDAVLTALGSSNIVDSIVEKVKMAQEELSETGLEAIYSTIFGGDSDGSGDEDEGGEDEGSEDEDEGGGGGGGEGEGENGEEEGEGGGGNEHGRESAAARMSASRASMPPRNRGRSASGSNDPSRVSMPMKAEPGSGDAAPRASNIDEEVNPMHEAAFGHRNSLWTDLE